MMNWEKLLLPEGLKPSDTDLQRSQFERDFDRIIFSAPFRNLQDKTQVFPLPENDFVHTRLTHSLEVSSVGRSLGKSTGKFLLDKYPALASKKLQPFDIGGIVATAALAHDIGNPPFGHAGEEAISDFFKFHTTGKLWQQKCSENEWEDLTNFEGNAQGFRMLVDKGNGMNISPATLAAFTKYPRPAWSKATGEKRRSQKKFGFYTSNITDYEHLAKGMGIPKLAENCWMRHPLAFLVEAADDICYSIIDLEDGCTLGLVSLEESISLMAGIIGDRYDPEKLQKYSSPKQKLAIMRAMTISRLIQETSAVFEEKEVDILSGEFDQALTEIIPSAENLEAITSLSVKKIYRSQPVLEKEAAGYQVLEGLLATFSEALFHFHFCKEKFSGHNKSILRLLPEELELQKSRDAYALMRGLLDFISGMTDKHALSLYRRVKGITIPGT
ncbi:dGTP triphosphohydrolase [Cyclobacterium marinum]|uniref:Deoxyguanosinetriphosphate triphosphohydrolase n=1 Tax=Cyclobacterium marinum (strain ATCC 25205 / DSM 745 / LMG 13164 / NCIMB 1802) TaxID=880070 RepID=G0J3N4_CYCMS|nr:deoxyguanosinetriphosphate triphosphohydrolase [Cyclobacterium marinum DSM 745]